MFVSQSFNWYIKMNSFNFMQIEWKSHSNSILSQFKHRSNKSGSKKAGADKKLWEIMILMGNVSPTRDKCV